MAFQRIYIRDKRSNVNGNKIYEDNLVIILFKQNVVE